jgi:RimJ/RimL family protein N-acetyltransferase
MPEVRLPYEFAAPLRTARLVLRTMTAGDVDDIHAYQSRADVCRYLEFEPRTHDEVAERVTKYGKAVALRGDVRAELDPRNAASIALCRRLGMREEAYFVEDLWFKGGWGDTGIYAILDREWAARS